MWKQCQISFSWAPKSLQSVTAATKIRRQLLLGRRAMTKLDSVLKCKDIILLTKVHLFKAIVFPVVKSWCESWTIKQVGHQRIDALNCSVGEDSWESLRLKRDQTSQFLKEINPDYSLEGLMLKLKLQYFRHLMWRADTLEKTLMLGKIEGRRRRGWKRMMSWLYGVTESWVWANCR